MLGFEIERELYYRVHNPFKAGIQPFIDSEVIKMRKKTAGTLLLLSLALLFTGPEAARGKGPIPGLRPLGAGGKMTITKDDRCPVCAMRPADHPKFSSAIGLKNGKTFYFCSTGCMIRSWMHPEAFLGVEKKELMIPVVREYFTGAEIDARDAEWIAGSDIVGPMGPALVPVKGEKAIEAFRRRHGGKIVFKLDEIDDKRWEEISGGRKR
jgi:nitrous oxide reductase accessory protein NosL